MERPKPPEKSMRPLEGRSRIIVTGPRNFHNKNFVWDTLNDLLHDYVDPIILTFTDKHGVGPIVQKWASFHWYLLRLFHPDVNKYGPVGANLVSIKEMLLEADALVCFWDGVSPRLKQLKKAARVAGLRVAVIKVDDETE